jgi:hypothetical protein
MAQLQALHDSGQHRACLQELARGIRMANNPASGLDPYALQLLRADCLLHEGDRASALAALRVAERSPNAAQAAQARALTRLVQQSQQMMFTPRTQTLREPISILDDKNRQRAMMALFEDTLAAAQPELNRARNATDLVPIIHVVPTLEELYSLEVAGSGSDQRIRPLIRDIGEQARMLMGRELSVLNDRITSIRSTANQLVGGSGPRFAANGSNWWNGDGTRRGLFSTDRQNLRDMVDYIDRIGRTAEQARGLALTFDGNVRAWDEIITQATRARGNAQNVLDSE